MRAKRCACLLVVWLTMVPALALAQTEIRVFVGGAVTEPVKEAGAAFTRTSRNTFVYVSDTTGALQKRLASGEKADVVVLAGPGMDALQKANLVAAGSRVDLARALIGVAVKAGAPSPDLSTPDTFKAALLKAKSVSYVNPAAGGTSGTYFEGLLQRMGIAETMKPKIVYRMQGSEVADAVAKGEAELGVSFTSELQPNRGVKVAGRAFLRSLTGVEWRAALTKTGLEPVGQ
jgi:molybdate transport system substrate-binding protein